MAEVLRIEQFPRDCILVGQNRQLPYPVLALPELLLQLLWDQLVPEVSPCIDQVVACLGGRVAAAALGEVVQAGDELLDPRPRFVLPEGSPPEAQDEIETIRRLLDPQQPPGAVIRALTPLQDLIRDGDFGLLHFACHNTYDSAGGPSITLDKRRFTPTHLTTAAIDQILARSAPTVFINACRTAGLTVTYNRLDGWASKFLEAGAAAFIGSLWAVSDDAACEFAGKLYGQLQAGSSLGQAVTCARKAAASQLGDPTWLAYTVYGDPRATIGRPDR